MATSSSNFLDISEACELLHVKRSYLYKLTFQRKVPFYKPFSGKVLFDRGELELFVKAGRVATRDELAARADSLLNSRGR
jgi:excisionase family DNA binding protein